MNLQTNQQTEQTAAMLAYCYLTVAQFAQKHPAFTIGGLRFQIFNEESNGLKQAGAIIRNGRRVLIKEAAYFAWLEANNNGGRANG